jgi:hypothetical protein
VYLLSESLPTSGTSQGVLKQYSVRSDSLIAVHFQFAVAYQTNLPMNQDFNFPLLTCHRDEARGVT